MTLQYPSPAAFAQSVKLRLQATSPVTPFVIVEGRSDRQAFGRVLAPGVKVIPARGKEMVLACKESLTDDERTRCTLVIDCDGEVSPEWLSGGDVIVSANRDLEADLVIDVGVMRVVAHDFLAPAYDDGLQIAQHVEQLEAYVLSLATSFGLVLDSARRIGRRVRIVDPLTGNKRRVRITDLPSLSGWIRNNSVPELSEIVDSVAAFVGWLTSDKPVILAEAQAGGQKPCRIHSVSDCANCKTRRFGNGHDIVEIAASMLSDHSGYAIATHEIARAIRIAIGADLVGSWEVVSRMKRREVETGLWLVAS